MRFANKLELADKTHEVSMTAQRLVQRMKKDSIHSGRRPSGLCGAALLLAARMHDFNRTPNDIVLIVKIHESTLRKRLLEFGETPSSALTLDEFMTVDLEAEQDPPAFKAARKKDKERIMKLGDADTELSTLQMEIEAALENDAASNGKRGKKRIIALSDVDVEEVNDTNQFIEESLTSTIQECLADSVFASKENKKEKKEKEVILEKNEVNDEMLKGPTTTCSEIVALCLADNKHIDPTKNTPQNSEENINDGELDMTDINDDELDGYIMTSSEAQYKDEMWNKLNAEYLQIARAREEKLAKEREEGKPEKKRRRAGKKKSLGPSNTAGEAIEKMLQEKKISNKINYDILKTLTDVKPLDDTEINSNVKAENEGVDILSKSRIRPESALTRKVRPSIKISTTRRNKPPPMGVIHTFTKPSTQSSTTEQPSVTIEKDNKSQVVEDDYDETDIEPEPEPVEEHSSLRNMLQQDAEEDYYYEDDY